MESIVKAGFGAVLALSALSAGAGGQNTHYFGVFGGVTNLDGRNETTWALEYEYKFAENWGAGLTYETILDGYKGKDDIDIILGAVYFHHDNWKFGLGAGEEDLGKKTKTLYRASIGYEYHLTDNIGIVPTFALDRAEGVHSRLYGVVVDVSF